MSDFETDRLVFGPDDVDLTRSPLAGQLGVETYVLGAFNPGLTRLPSGNLLIMVRVAEALREPEAQVLVLVPEINLTPQLEGVFRTRFPNETLVTLHSGLAEGERARHWLAAHRGEARVVLGTRLAIMASLPHLRLIVIDEEHDPSYKQQEGLRYSARDLAIWRANRLRIPVVLGSATPSLDSWRRADQGRYVRLAMPERATPDAVLPRVSLEYLTRLAAGQSMQAVRLSVQDGDFAYAFD